jgi:membrane protease YdiL (CAAX protease family)
MRGHPSPPLRVQVIEFGVFLFLFVPFMVLSFLTVRPESLTFPVLAFAGTLKGLALLSLVLYLVWRNGESFSSIGCTWHKGRTEIVLGAVLFLPVTYGIGLLERLLREAGLSFIKGLPSYLVPTGTLQVLLAFVFLIVVAISEEVIFRGYLILRFRALAGNRAVALLLSTAVFSIGHGYEESGGVIAVGILGLVFGLVYLWRGSLLAPMVMHFLQNFIGLILVPLGVVG